MRRRDFLRAAASVPAVAILPASFERSSSLFANHSPHRWSQTTAAAIVKAPKLRTGDTVGIVTPATATFRQVELDIVRESLEALGLKVKVGDHVMDRFGSLGGVDEARADDINRFIRDGDVRAIIPTRGGWGSSRLLPLIDYDRLRRDPKIVMGYSDITALLNGIHARTGLITFHGPNGGGRWDAYSLDLTRRVLFQGEAVTFSNPRTENDRNVLTQIENRIRTIAPGRARGRLIGGNLTVLTAIMGSPYVPSMDGAILFLEDVSEQFYRVDRMMTQLRLSGALARIRGAVFGTCSECSPGEGYASFTLEEILDNHLEPLKVPAWQGAMIGHDTPQWTLPVGLEVEIDATAGTLRMTEAGVA
jgi:muramoyltetrapeptide carboxypeptidase